MNLSVTGVGLVAPGVRGARDLVLTDAPDPAEADRDWFDPVLHLGPRGWKYMTPATRYLLAAANAATGRSPGEKPPHAHDATRLGVCAGTHHSIGAMHARLDRTIREQGPAGLSPAELPGFSVNMPASQLAISMACRAFSVTLTNPVVGGLDAVLFAMSALRRGRADRVLATATEDACAAAGTLGGAAALMLDIDADQGSPQLTGGLSRFVPRAAHGGWEPAALTTAADRIAALGAGEHTVRYAFCGSAVAAPVDESVQKAFAAAGIALRTTAFTGGDARFGTVSALLQLAGLLEEPGPGLVVAVSDDGHLAAVTLLGAARGGPARA
ncbi:beta-ketoacyl synthase N-terminal-like domain-containing protein [Streptomyces sp. H10-C2]|uniref:beta-ketoacyl synthase N-terminal-like domain-containing protein n=1 Tax=unclassified Streptomyces TaxID=2593676 RepID=UPI0024BAE27E|nr:MULTISPECIES: beta-ketoacyl synthase N-terminal-like domain-containing protein [unclassified Streptomyces]MDJ0346550.1 beta-ketoacyl synthase N-terminal-like domain-containing protein [Streptomyces sp. PH10-H1]MDJ0374355.1 beta-ketoacyl synthase N-terminal-like domain-containing protein [Streptomyces sp. H10-C2]